MTSSGAPVLPTDVFRRAPKVVLHDHLDGGVRPQTLLELAAEVATRVVVLAEGEIVADGNTADVVVASPMFAPQVAKVLAPEPWLTVSDVLSAIGPLLLRSHAPTSGDAVG